MGVFLLCFGWQGVDEGSVGVEVSLVGKHVVAPEPLEAGIYWRRPFLVRIHQYPIHTSTENLEIKMTSNDQRKIKIRMKIYFQLMADQIVSLHKKFGNFYAMSQYVKEITTGAVQECSSNLSSNVILAQTEFLSEILSKCKKNLSPIGIIVSNIIIDNIYFEDGISNEVAKLYPIHPTSVLVERECTTSDLKRIFVRFQLYYHIPFELCHSVHLKMGTGYLNHFLIPQFKSLSDSVLVDHTFEEIYFSHARSKIVEKLFAICKEKFATYQIVIDDVLIESINFDQKYQALLDEIQLKHKESELIELSSALELKKLEEEKKKKNIEQELQLQEAEIKKKVAALQAEGIKNAEILKAEGQVEALMKMKKILEDNPEVLKYLYIDKISDKVEVIVVPTQEWFDVLHTHKSKK